MGKRIYLLLFQQYFCRIFFPPGLQNEKAFLLQLWRKFIFLRGSKIEAWGRPGYVANLTYQFAYMACTGLYLGGGGGIGDFPK